MSNEKVEKTTQISYLLNDIEDLPIYLPDYYGLPTGKTHGCNMRSIKRKENCILQQFMTAKEICYLNGQLKTYTVSGRVAERRF